MIELSVVIPVYNNWWMTARTLRELDRLRSASARTFETIVVDNHSSDETQRAIEDFPWVRYARMDRNTNFAGGCNAGARLASAPLVLFLNNDAYPLGDAFAPLVRAFDREKVAIAGGALFFEDGATQGAGFVVLPDAHWHYFCRNLPAALAEVTQSRDALGVSGAAMAVRTGWFLESGGFDESFVNGFEDVDLCMRAREAGRTIRYVAEARFAHYEGATAGRFDREAENERRFYDRWSAAFAGMPRTARGDVGAISVLASPQAAGLSLAGLEDLEIGLRSFGHPLRRGKIHPWEQLDPRYRHSASLGWFTDVSPPGISIRGSVQEGPTIETHGAASLRVPWLPCASVERLASLPLRFSREPSCQTLALTGFDSLAPDQKAETTAALGRLTAGVPELHLAVITWDGGGELQQRFGERASAVDLLATDVPPVEVACILHAGLSDESAFGNVLLAQAGIPAIAFADETLHSLFAADVALFGPPDTLEEMAMLLLSDPAARVRYAALVAADARRRFSPRRSAIRVVDLLCAARFGPERPARARRNTPL